MTILVALTKGFLLFAATGILASAALAQQYQPTEIAPNVTDPSELVILPGGNFLTVQPGPRPNRGTLYFFDKQGDFTWVLLGLPAPARYAGSTAPSGPDGLAASGKTLYIATGEVPDGTAPPSDTQASILRVTFSRNLADQPGPFFLQPSDYLTLLSGGTVTLGQGDNTAQVSLLVKSIDNPAGLSVDTETGRLYIVSRTNRTISWVLLQ